MSQLNTTAYDLQRPTGRCAFTDVQLLPGDTYYATLVELTQEQLAQMSAADRSKNALGLRRLDVSAPAWEQGQRPENLFGYWKTIVAQPNQKKKMFVDDSVLLNLLERLAQATEPERIAFRHVLALILLRKKLLRYDGIEKRDDPDQDGPVQDWWQFTPKLDPAKGPLGKWHEGNTLSVLDPRLDDSQIEQVTAQLTQVLDGEL